MDMAVFRILLSVLISIAAMADT